MQDINKETEDEKPLDPEMEKVRRKMVRLLGVSLGVMFIGVMAVLVAVVYKINSGDEEKPNMVSQSEIPGLISTGELEIVLPVGFKVTGFDLDGARGAVTGTDEAGKQRVLIVDLQSGEVITNILLRN